jgi:Kef-type K+ transport system membrane component KefB
MATDDQPKQSRERLVTAWDWIGCSLIAALSTLGNAKNYPNAGIGELIPRFIGALAVVVILWVIVRGFFRWVTKKRDTA